MGNILGQPMSNQTTTRLAPSPTGALHLGNARTFLINWAMARQRGWRVVLRIEDLDSPRTKPGANAQAIDILQWLGMDWDDGPYGQLADLAPYRRALTTLAERGLIYPCTCTRSEIARAQSAPHEDDHELRYPGTHRPDEPSAIEYRADTDQAWRVIVPDCETIVRDELHGPLCINVQQQVGDFVVATKQGLPAYQLAVVVDDARQGVDAVVRGDDLLRSTARQALLYDMLDLEPRPAYWHVPLVLGEDGRRLAKRHGDTRLVEYRRRGVRPDAIIGLIAAWSGCGERRPMTAAAFVREFSIDHLPRGAVTFTNDDHDWLVEQTA